MSARLLLVALAVAATACDRQSAEAPADLVFTNGYIYTGDGQRAVVEAIAIRGDRIVDLGSTAAMQAYVGPDTRVRDLGGGCVHLLAARDSMAALSSPRVGGELNSEPTTEKRKRAHKVAVEDSGFLVIRSPRKSGANDWKTTLRPDYLPPPR